MSEENQEPKADYRDPATSGKMRGEVTPEYVSELRGEAAKRRVENVEVSKKLEETTKQLAETKEESRKALEQVAAVQAKAHQTMLRAELKVVANKYGLRDIEDVKLADLTGVKVDDNGDVIGVEAAVAALKEKKGYLFDTVSTSRSEGFAPAAHSGQAEDPNAVIREKVDKMNANEFDIHVQKYIASL